MGNLDFAHHAFFAWYCLLLMAAGITMLVLGTAGTQTTGRRVLRLVFGAVYFCYGFYLTFIFTGGHYLIFFKAFIFPVLLLIDWYRTSAVKRRRAAQSASSAMAAGAGAQGTSSTMSAAGYRIDQSQRPGPPDWR